MKIIFNDIKYSLEEIKDLQALPNTEELENINLSNFEDLEPESDSIDEHETVLNVEETLSTDNRELTEDNRVLDTCVALNSLAESILLSKDKITLETISLVNSLCVSGTDIRPKQFISIESINEKDLSTALEGIGEKISAAVINISSGIVKLLQNFIPMAKSFLTLFTLKRKKLFDLKINLDKLPEENLEITTAGSRYFAYGENSNSIQSAEEYIREMLNAGSLISSVNDATIKYTKSRFLSKTVTFFSHFIPGVNYDKNFLNLYDSLLNELLNPLAKIANNKSSGNIGDQTFTEYKSDIVLGGWQLKVKIADITRPNNKDELSTAVKKTIGVIPLNTVEFSKVTTPVNNTVKMKITKKHVIQIINESLKLVDEIEKHINVIVKWNLFFSNELAKIKNLVLGVGYIPYLLISQLSSSVRLVRLGSYLTTTMIGSAYSACNGLLNNNIRIIQASLKS